MLLSLMKKDFLLIKNYVLLMLAVTIIIPPFVLLRLPEFEEASILGFILSVIYPVFMLVQFLSQKESQYPKAAALLCAAPYPRDLLVLSKYAFCICIFIASCIIFGMETLLLPRLGVFHYQLPILMFFAIALFFGVYFPIEYRLGYEKTRFVFMLVILASPFVLPFLLKMKIGLNLPLLGTISHIILYGGMVIVSILILAVSALVSIRIYRKIDLM